MTDVKVLDGDELRAAHTLFRAALHEGPATDEGWALSGDTFLPGRTFGGHLGGTLAGITMSIPMAMTVPGGAVLPSAAVTRVGVRADLTRRGVLTALMREQLAALGEPIASLRASQYPIYGRYGYGVATRGCEVRVDPNRRALHPLAPTGGDVRLVPTADLATVLAEVYRRIGAPRPGMLHRIDSWWRLNVKRPGSSMHLVGAVHTGPDGDDGYVVYHTESNSTPADPHGTALRVDDLHAATPQANAALWRFVLGVDLINEVQAWLRPLDEPLPLLLADARAARVTSTDDETWLRLVDVDAALAARSWAGQDAVVVAVTDPVLPGNTGHYRISPDGVLRTGDEPDLRCDVAVLGRLYLGDLAPSRLAAAGWLTARDERALRAADALFATGVVPWSGTYF